jgi:hypothetical protein
VATEAWRIADSEETYTFTLLVILLGDEDGEACSTHEINKKSYFHIPHSVRFNSNATIEIIVPTTWSTQLYKSFV